MLARASVLAALLAAAQPARAWEPVDLRHPKWKGGVAYLVHPASSRLAVASDWQAQLAAAASAWRSDRCRHPTLAPVGQTDVRPDVSKHGADGISVIGWEESVWPYGKGTHAVTQPRWGRDAVIVEADILLNGVDYRWDGKVAGAARHGRLHLYSVLLHEFGHVLGLGHSFDSSALMMQESDRVFHGPAEDDIQGLCALYGVRSSNASDRDLSVDRPIWKRQPAIGLALAGLAFLGLAWVLRKATARWWP